MPWSTSNRAARLPKDWHAQRARCYRAAGAQCEWVTDGQRCPWTGPLNGTKDNPGGHADHINRALGNDSPRQWLCPTHHLRKSSCEGHDAMRKQRAKAEHPTQHHPSLTPRQGLPTTP